MRAQFETDINIRMSKYSIGFFRDVGIRLRIRTGGISVFATTDGQFDYLKRNVEKQRSFGIEGVEMLDTNAIAKRVPGLNCDDITGGSFGKTTDL